MASKHICADSCFDGVKLRNKQPINCFSCIKKFNPKCFNINIQLKDSDNIVFLCCKCISSFKEYSKNRKSTSRNSFNSQIASKNTQSLLHLNNTAVQQPNNQSETNNLAILNDIDTRLNAILGKLTSLNDNSIAEKSENIDTKISKLTSTIDNTYNLLSKVDCKMNKMSTSEEIKSATKNICGSFAEYTEALNQNLNSATSNELFTHNSIIDWSMRADNSINMDFRRHSIVQNCSIGDNIVEIIKSHEKSTWESIDELNKKLTTIGNDLNNKIDTNTSKLSELHSLTIDGYGSENFHVMEKPKDAIAQLNNNIETAETFKSKQKRQMPTPSDVELESTAILNVNDSDSTTPIHTIDSGQASGNETSHSTLSKKYKIQNNQVNNIKSLHLSNLDTDTTAEDIFNYITDKGITALDQIQLFKLIRKDTDISLYSFISYKIETTNEIADILLQQDFWPNTCTIKEFINKNSCKSTSLKYFANFPNALHQQVIT